MKSHYLHKIGFLLFLGVVIYLAFNRHSRSGYFNYHSEIWGDKAGYYVYLPAVLKFNLNPTEFPDSMDVKTGYGFMLDEKNDRVVTKYTYGVALMQLPFFCLAELLAEPLGYKKDGFSPIYHWAVNVAAAFYLVLGLLFLKNFLARYFDNTSALLAVLSIFLATNLYYYSIDETGMSHVYSFFLFCIWLHFLQTTQFLTNARFWKSLLFGFLAGLIMLTRPTNVLFLSTFFFLDVHKLSEATSRIKRLIHYKTLIPVLVGVVMFVLPQLLYWNYTNNSLVSYSYEGEGFNWLNPKLLYTWFAPRNGLFLYTPFYVFIIGSLLLMIKHKKSNGFYILALFFAISYVFSSWWDWGFGCSFGGRCYVEYLALFSIPVAAIFFELRKLKTVKSIVFSITILLLVIVNLKMSYAYSGCFNGDWNEYLEFLRSLK